MFGGQIYMSIRYVIWLELLYAKSALPSCVAIIDHTVSQSLIPTFASQSITLPLI